MGLNTSITFFFFHSIFQFYDFIETFHERFIAFCHKNWRRKYENRVRIQIYCSNKMVSLDYENFINKYFLRNVETMQYILTERMVSCFLKMTYFSLKEFYASIVFAVAIQSMCACFSFCETSFLSFAQQILNEKQNY